MKIFLNFLKEVGTVIGQTLSNWLSDRVPLHAAALAFYTIFSLAPFLLIIIALTGFFFGEQAAEGQLAEYMEQMMGEELSKEIEAFVASAYRPGSGIIASAIAVGVILFASTTVITQMKDSLNQIWNVETKSGQGIKRFLIDRTLALALILIFTAFMIASIILEGVLGFLEPVLDPVIPYGVQFWSLINDIIMVIVTTSLFAIIFKMLPDIKIRWTDVWVGAIATTLMFLFGRYMITLYITGGMMATTYGAAGTFVIFLIWVYYNAMVVFLGAEFTKIYTNRYGSKIKPAEHAVFVPAYLEHDAAEDDQPYIQNQGG